MGHPPLPTLYIHRNTQIRFLNLLTTDTLCLIYVHTGFHKKVLVIVMVKQKSSSNRVVKYD